MDCSCTYIKGMFLYSAVSSPLDYSPRFARHPLSDLFIPTQTRLLGEAFSHAAITREDYSLTFPPPSIAGYSFIQLSELGRRRKNEQQTDGSQEMDRSCTRISANTRIIKDRSESTDRSCTFISENTRITIDKRITA